MQAKPYIEGNLVLAIDFDGTITEQPDVGYLIMTLRPHVKEVLSLFYEKGVRLQLWTCRTGDSLDQAKEFLKHHGMLELFDTINDQLPEIKERYNPVARKLGADYYIDDKNILFEVDWIKIKEFVLKMIDLYK